MKNLYFLLFILCGLGAVTTSMIFPVLFIIPVVLSLLVFIFLYLFVKQIAKEEIKK